MRTRNTMTLDGLAEKFNSMDQLQQKAIIGGTQNTDPVYTGYPIETVVIYGDRPSWYFDPFGYAHGIPPGGTAGENTSSASAPSNMWSASALAGYAGFLVQKNAYFLQMTANEATLIADIANANKAVKVFVRMGQATGVVGAVLTGIEGYTDGNGMTIGDWTKVGIGLVATFTPYGWAFSLIDIATGAITGTTITDRIGQAIDRPD